ncbi:MAG: KamA family radical SAM protein, partial [Ectothiorhodospira sp.]
MITEAIEYIRKTPEIHDVIISGGDPLTLPDERLEEILKEVSSINHVNIIRIHSRMPSFYPERITPKLVGMLSKYHPIFFNTHFNHPRELTPIAQEACRLLVDSGIPLGCQTVLLKGINDRPEIMRELFYGLLKMRVRPYH